MPIYEYQCTICAHHFEILQKMTEDALTDCPHCHQQALKKLVSAAGFQLKGTGWYVTDYSKKAKSEDSSSSSASSSDSAKTDSKGAAETKSTETKSDNSSSSSSSAASS